MGEYIITKKTSIKFWLVLTISGIISILSGVIGILSIVLDWERVMVITLVFILWGDIIGVLVLLKPYDDVIEEIKKKVIPKISLDQQSTITDDELLKEKKFLEKWKKKISEQSNRIDLKLSSSNSNSPEVSKEIKNALSIGRHVLATLPSMEEIKDE